MSAVDSAPAFTATYRLQFSRAFRFDDARRLVPYLSSLGVSHIYASPLLRARPGSSHGYDIVDHQALNPDIGDAAAFSALVAELHRHGMGLILDFVPNHMGVGPDNPWWVDVLEWGRSSPYAEFFDIDWEPQEPSLAGRVLLPVLGDHYGAVLARGELALHFDPSAGTLSVRYFDHGFPIAPRHYPPLLREAAAHSPAAGDALRPLAAEWQASLDTGRSRRALVVRRTAVAALKTRLARTVTQVPAAREAVEAVVASINGRPEEPGSFDALHRLLERQVYRLAFWRVAAHEINYRRFFDINELAGLRMEQPDLFAASHQLVRRLIADGSIQGLRLDHVDGLRDPRQYFDRLQRLAADAGADGFVVLVEKILAPHEQLRADWAVAGTTGYEFLAGVQGVFIDPTAERHLTRFYERLIGHPAVFDDMVVDAKRQIMTDLLASELAVLANGFNRLAKQDRRTRDFSRLGLRDALINVVAHFPVYRTYLAANGATRDDRRDIDWAVGRARRLARTPDTSIYDFIHGVLTLDLVGEGRSYRRRDVVDMALKFQQYTGPVTAKAMEDTAFYRYVRLVSLNEVGGHPDRFGTRPRAFHEANQRRLRGHPRSMLATATHDHKRGEDVRARLAVVTEIPQEWTRRVRRWMQLNARKRRKLAGGAAPTPNDEYLYYQTIVGAWPHGMVAPAYEGLAAFRDRIGAYMTKAIREAKLETRWAAPNEEYEHAVAGFVARTLDPAQSRPFLDDVAGLVDRIAPAGAVNGLSQILLKLVSPGVPDTYQGTERWDLSLVDPDNRRPVDYAERTAALAGLPTAAPADLLPSWRDGRLKQFVLHRVLGLRRRHPALFERGAYRALDADGPEAERLVAIGRVHADAVVVAVAPRLVWPLLQNDPLPLPRGWTTTSLVLPDESPWNATLTDVLSGRRVRASGGRLDVSALLTDLPVALLAAGLEATRAAE